MFHPVSLFVALRYLRGRPSDRFARFVSLFSTIGILLGVLSLIIVLSVMNGFEKEQEKNILYFQPHAILSKLNASLNAEQNIDSLAELQPFFNDPQNKNLIVDAQPIVQANVVLQSANNISPALMLGVLPDQQEPLFNYFMQSKPSDLVEGNFSVVLGSDLARQLGVGLGDEVRLLVPSVTQFTPMGRIPSQRIFTVIGFFHSNNQVDSTQIFIHRHDASKLMRYPNGNVTGFRLFLDRPLNINLLNTSILPKDFIVKDWRERQGELFQAIRMEKNMMGLLLSLIITVAAFNIVTSLSLVVMEKQNEIAILQTLGMTKNKLLSIFIIQGASSGILGSIGGAIIATIIVSQVIVIPSVGEQLFGRALPVDIDFVQIAVITFSAIAISLLSAFYPALKAASTMPAQALRYE